MNQHVGKNVRVQLIAGDLKVGGNEICGAVTGKSTRPLIADVTLLAGSRLSLEYPADITSQLYVYQGVISVSGKNPRDTLELSRKGAFQKVEIGSKTRPANQAGLIARHSGDTSRRHGQHSLTRRSDL